MRFSRNAAPRHAVAPSSRPRPSVGATRGPAGASPPAAGKQLAARLRSIAKEAAGPEEALEPALRAILDDTRASAGAVCLFDISRRLLRLVAETGLSDDGCRALRNMRGGLADVWDMPLQSLLNRRVYLIDNASENRYVPPLVDDVKGMHNVACLPLYAGPDPVGSLVIVTVRPTSLHEQHIERLKEPQRELVLMIEALRQQADRARTARREAATPVRQRASTSAKGAAQTQQPGNVSVSMHAELTAEIARLRSELEQAHADAAAHQVEHGAAQVAEVEDLLELLNDAREAAEREERSREELQTILEQERARATTAVARSTEADARAAAQSAEVERLRVQLARAKAADATREEELRAAGRTAQTALDGEVERLRGELSNATAAAAAREAELVDQLGTRREEQERELEAVRARERQASEELAAARERAAALEAAAADRQQEHAAELERVTAAALAAREAELVDQLGTRREEQERELEAVRARERQASEELAAARERAAALEAAAADRQREHAAELKRVTAAAKAAREAVRTQGAQLADTTDELASALEQERMRAATAETQASEADARAAAQSAEVERLRAELVQAQAALDGEVERLQVDLSNATAAAAAREADLIGQLQARQAEHEGELEAALEAARAREHEAGEELAAAVTRERERVAVLEAAVADGQREHAAECERLTQRLAETEAALTQEAARIEELRRDRNELREHVAAASDREQALHVKIDGQHHVAEAHGAELTEANERALAAERDLEIVRAEAATLREQLDEANVRIEEIHRTVVHPDVQQPERPAAQPTARDQAQAEPRNVPPECAPVASPPTVPTESMATNAVVTADAGSVVIIDAEESWSGESLDGGLITVVAPGSDAAVRLTSASAGTFMVNLAVSGALSVVAELRAAGVTTPCWGYIAAPGSDQALKLGIIETTPRPMDPDAVIGMLERHLGRGKRLLTAGADPDAFMSLRQALIRKGVSVSMAWDSNQALDLVTMSRPEVAVVDLDLPPRDGYGVVASLAALAPVPAVVLVEKDADGADRFAAAAADRRYTKLLVARHQVLTDVVKESGAPDAVAADS